MLRRGLVLLMPLALIVLAATSARAETPPVLKNVPASCQVVIVVKSMDGLQQKATALAKAMGLADQLGDLTDRLAQARQLNLGQLDRSRAVVLLIPAVPAAEGAKLEGVMLLPVKDFKAFVADNKAETKGNEQVIASGKAPLLVRQLDGYVVLADSAPLADRIVKMTDPSLADGLSAQEQELLSASQAWVRVNVAPVFAALQPRLDKQAKALAAGEQSMPRSVLQIVQRIAKDSEALDFGLVVGDDGVELRGLLLAKDKSPMAEAFSSADKPAGSVVANVPLGNFLIAGGKGPGLKSSSEFSQRISDELKKLGGKATGDPEQAKRVADAWLSLDKLVKTESFSVTAGTAEGKVSLPVVVTAVAEVTDGPAAQKALHNYLEELPKLKFPAPAGTPAGEAKPASAWVLGQDEDVAGVKVEKLVCKVDLLLPGLGDEAQMLPKVFGEDELAVRTAVKGNMLVVTLGGKLDAVKAAFKAIEDKVTGQADPGIAKIKPHLVAGASGEVYLAVDRLANVALGVVAGLAGVNLPEFPKVAEPVAISVGYGDRSAHLRLFVPASLLQSGWKFVSDLQRQQGGEEAPASAPTPKPPVR